MICLPEKNHNPERYAVTSLYNKYRPHQFSQIVGQEQAVSVLSKVLSGEAIPHTYLFSGPRGCGKTTTARIFAKAVNCENPNGVEPCGACDSCVAIDNGTSFAIEEIDAASHNGVEDMKALMSNISLATDSKRKVYIIDEAHMLTQQAGNASLKGLEEPPEHVIFILATTEPNKILPTVRSRCLPIRFHLVPPPEMMDYARKIINTEITDSEISEDTLVNTVFQGKGSVRDTLSYLEMVMLAGSDVTFSNAFTTVEAIAKKDVGAIMENISLSAQNGIGMREFTEELMSILRDVFLIQMGSSNLVSTPDWGNRQVMADWMGAKRTVQAINFLSEAITAMTAGYDERVHLEISLARYCAIPDA